MKSRLGWLVGAALLALALTVWRVAVYVPAPGRGRAVAGPAGPPVSVGQPARAYALADDEIIRYIPAPDPEARRRLLERPGRAQRSDIAPVVSVTVVWDGAPRVRWLESGYEIVPRRLLRVLIGSLGVPPYRLEGIDVARAIGLSGDWVVRPDADLDRCMSYVEEVVQRSGHPGFRIVRTLRKRRAHDMRGVASAPERAIPIFEPHPDASPAHEQSGTLAEFGQALSAAIQRPVSIHAEPEDLVLAWRDNSGPYLDLGASVSDEMIANLLNEVSRALGVEFTDSEVEMTVWRLELNVESP